MKLSLAMFLLTSMGIFLFGIWVIYNSHKSIDDLRKYLPSNCPLYDTYKKRVAIFLSLLGFLGMWGSAASVVTVVDSAALEILASSPGRMTVEIEVYKQRGCTLSSIKTESITYSGKVKTFIKENPELLVNAPEIFISGTQELLSNSAKGYDPDFVILELVKEEGYAVHQVEFTAYYSCPFGFEVESPIGSLTPEASFNLSVP